MLLVPRLSDSLAGRMAILRLHPLSQAELARRPSDFLEARLGKNLVERIVAGGYPAALARPPGRRAGWYEGYVETVVQRDVRDLARINALATMPRLLALAAGQTLRLLNITDLAGPFQLSRPTIRDCVTLLERVFLIEILPPWHSNQLSRLIKTPKLHVGDTGLACALLGLNATSLAADRGAWGQTLETFVYQELRRQASWRDEPSCA